MNSAPEASSRLFYGWVMVGLAFLTQFVATGWIFYSLSVALTALADEFADGQRTPIMMVHPLMSLVGIAITPLLGRLVGLGHSRAVMTAAALSTGTGLLLIAEARALWQFQLAFATLLAFGGVGLSNLVCAPLVSNWFEARRAQALGLSQVGASMGGAVMSPVVGLLLADLGWRQAYQVLGISALCVAPLVWWLLVARPEDRGLRPDGASAAPGESAAGAAPLARPVTAREALRDRDLWLIAVATGLAFIGSSSLLNHIVSFGVDAGFGASAAWLASILSGSAAVGKPVFGYLCDRVGDVKAFGSSCLGFAAGVLLLGSLDGFSQVAVAAGLTGLSMGGLLPVSSSLMARVFGRDQMGPKMGVAMPIVTAVQLGGPLATAAVYDATGSYDLAFYGIACSLVVSSQLVRLVKPAHSLA